MTRISFEDHADGTREYTSAGGYQIGMANFCPERRVFVFRCSWPIFVPWADQVSSGTLETIDRLAWAVDAEVSHQLS